MGAKQLLPCSEPILYNENMGNDNPFKVGGRSLLSGNPYDLFHLGSSSGQKVQPHAKAESHKLHRAKGPADPDPTEDSRYELAFDDYLRLMQGKV